MSIKLNSKKSMSMTSEVVDFSNPKKVYVPLINQSVLCKCVTKIGKTVKKGTIIGKREDLDFPILSPVSGEVVDIKKMLHNSGKEVDCVVIENDFNETQQKKVLIKDITNYTKDEFIEILRSCGVVGMGGSEFPTFLKYKGDSEILIVNAVECEPYLSADTMLVKLKADIILESIDAIRKINNMKKCFIAYKETNKTISDAFMRYIGNYEDIVLIPVKDEYPAGWERSVVRSVLGIEYERFPSEVGIVVQNVSTVYAIYKALKFNRNITKRIVTISGEGFTEPINALVKTGTVMRDVIKKIGDYKPGELCLIAGGPMMGTSLPSDRFTISNSLGGVTVLIHEDDELNECMGCGRCIKACPAKLCPIFIRDNLNNPEKLKELHPELCVSCGACSYVCPSKIGLREAVSMAKKKVK